MGKSVDSMQFTSADCRSFRNAMEQDLIMLADLLNRPGFGVGKGSLGAELEVYLIDGNGSPLDRNVEICNRMRDEQLTLELNRFNLEYNLSPVLMDEQPFLDSEQQMLTALAAINDQAARYGGHVVPVGILPTLALADFDHHTMTDMPRFHALRKKLQEERRGLFRIDIEGDEDSLSLATDDITLEGANTSFQIHYRVNPADFADTFNAIQLATPLVLALSANSPIVFGRCLWHETRIPLFKQSIDSRAEQKLDSLHWQQPARVNFGHGWVREGAWELFAEAVRLYAPLLPLIRSHPDEATCPPALHELRMQMGTLWLWNRPVYDDTDGGHLRIEMRSLPSGPTPVDMMANAALMVGLAEGLRGHIRELITALPFRHATQNFYHAARRGIGAELVWPSTEQSGLKPEPVLDLLARLLPVASQGLRTIGVDQREAEHYLGLIDERIHKQTSGARWQLQALEKLERTLGRGRALRVMLESYSEQSAENIPLAQWELPR